ncbi:MULTISPECIES: ribulose-phosphate 3-epimerase [Staphylococcus]|mgnify:FL=1|uniref:Ribulose-phosphate 3-epimerase n=1 Tax=Staphylococcus ureilyticus TaxID=94138 RepID=A0AB34AG89_STAUR|nr:MULTISPECIES: ribulose-phosphate 3-epimerase [Staphylococcus]AVL78460.1 ribulose-phosphate 3-epimerase [Staphylococcus cohnii]MBL0376699.1 ribulose-phosphate 3-epimerase [Staphylococcus sp. S75]MBL0382784.1 ribulose-phosphate 3-epimerase [Staphylococcus sp. S59]MBL0401212.1 ribulose-phosphate 3-epimerase [Staphylococcus sp. S36]MCT1913715.1 ribulose-phosphate 3-epimerase [Staphylococcus ureilyticus]
MAKLYPSLLSADFLQLQKELKALEDAGVDGVHFDVMDGQFVPNISIGLPILEAVRKGTNLPIDVHLMIEEPEKYVELFAAQGADMISVHVEATPHIHRVIQQIKKTNVKAGVVINPGTSVNTIMPVLKMVDYVLVMTVNPGFGGQTFIQDSISKLDELVKIKKALNLSFEIEVDGGINDETVATVIEHGATMLVAGSYFFKQKDYKQVTQTLKG